MVDCAIVGDSIAVGIAARMPRCISSAKIGEQAAAIVGRVRDADVLIVSAGSNGPHAPDLEGNLKLIRAKATARVIWILPVDVVASATVKRVAKEHDDIAVRFDPCPDLVHPASYDTLVAILIALLSTHQ